MADWLGKGGFRLSLRQESLRAVYSCDHKRNGKSIASREITPMISQRPRDASTRTAAGSASATGWERGESTIVRAYFVLSVKRGNTPALFESRGQGSGSTTQS